uniref:Uncharacterized protein n=1 Tax=Pararge aegeria TaxID=116150 RepID=S4PKS9_9NEOP
MLVCLKEINLNICQKINRKIVHFELVRVDTHISGRQPSSGKSALLFFKHWNDQCDTANKKSDTTPLIRTSVDKTYSNCMSYVFSPLTPSLALTTIWMLHCQKSEVVTRTSLKKFTAIFNT